VIATKSDFISSSSWRRCIAVSASSAASSAARARSAAESISLRNERAMIPATIAITSSTPIRKATAAKSAR
jgi:hypothetical protein